MEAEHGSQVKWVRTVDEGLFELPVDVESFECGGQSPEGAGDPDSLTGPVSSAVSRLTSRWGLAAWGHRRRR